MPFFVPQKVFLLELNLQKIGTGFFGGEGFIMQKLEGDASLSCTQAELYINVN